MNFGTSGSTNTVTLVDAGAPSIKVSSYTYKIADHGVYANLLISDSIQETLHVMATDYVTPCRPWCRGTIRLTPRNMSCAAGPTMSPGPSRPILSRMRKPPASSSRRRTYRRCPRATRPITRNTWPFEERHGRERPACCRETATCRSRSFPCRCCGSSFSLLPPSYSSSTVISQIQVAKVTASNAIGRHRCHPAGAGVRRQRGRRLRAGSRVRAAAHRRSGDRHDRPSSAAWRPSPI